MQQESGGNANPTGERVSRKNQLCAGESKRLPANSPAVVSIIKLVLQGLLLCKANIGRHQPTTLAVTDSGWSSSLLHCTMVEVKSENEGRESWGSREACM